MALEWQASGIPSIPFSLSRPFWPDSPPATSAGGNSGAIRGNVRLKRTQALATYSWRRNSHPHASLSPWEVVVLTAVEAEYYFRRFAAGALLHAEYARDNVDNSSNPSLRVVHLAADLRGTLVPGDPPGRGCGSCGRVGLRRRLGMIPGMSPGRDGPGVCTGCGMMVTISPVSIEPSPSRVPRDKFGKF